MSKASAWEACRHLRFRPMCVVVPWYLDLVLFGAQRTRRLGVVWGIGKDVRPSDFILSSSRREDYRGSRHLGRGLFCLSGIWGNVVLGNAITWDWTQVELCQVQQQ
jgi:hypothetical protein